MIAYLMLTAAGATPLEDHILDEYPWQECSPPSDDTWIVRMGGRAWSSTSISWFPQEPEPGDASFGFESVAGSYPAPTEPDDHYFLLSSIPLPYEAEMYWRFRSSLDHPSRSLQSEFSYGMGDEWPEEIVVNQQSLYHSLSYNAEEDADAWPWDDYIVTFCNWDEVAYDPRECFVGWTMCISHLRPDRMVMAWTMDATQASEYREHLPNPVMMVFDEMEQYGIATLLNFKVGEAFTSENLWYEVVYLTVFGDKALSVYYSDTTEEEVWSHLHSDTGVQ